MTRRMPASVCHGPGTTSWCGDIDITGQKKAQSYFRDVVWGRSKLEMAFKLHHFRQVKRKRFQCGAGRLNIKAGPGPERKEIHCRYRFIHAARKYALS